MSGHSAVTAIFRRVRVIPVIVMDDPSHAVGVADALAAGGLPCAEITLRTPAAMECLKRMSDARPDVLVGAGTVLSEKQAAGAIKAGAKFVVSPGFSESVVDFCLAHQVPIYPGVCTPTEIEMALRQGLSELKFFPAEAMGGVKYLKAVSAPYRDVRFIPTGGVTPANILEYLAIGAVIACGGSWMTPADQIAAGRFGQIEQSARSASALVQSGESTP
ncbi:MAG: bifunctional 4-hydroxy-2-oxoglutarate aldolase/2-dehydro-3-deoxy-phosphogluconate aldolase [Gemmatimonadaceae bacterium]|nr:bifunctional 4-hydroxy-2-oxoglutarate aldolase/2-dehydro-3-deoxy-phosphogluconate aldolase [Gemmatimonadaceae bacterium]